MNPSKTMRKTFSFYETKTLGSKAAPLHLSFGFYTLFHCDIELVVKGRTYPCTGIGILLNSRKYCMLVPVPVSVVPVPMWYRYHFASGDFSLGGTGTGTTWPLLISYFGVPVPVRGVLVPLPLHLFPNIIALPKTSP